MMRRREAGVLLLGMALLLWGCSKTEEPARREAPRPVVRGVAVETVGRRAVPAFVEAPGTVRSRQRSLLSSKIVATVVAVRVREGERVTAGQVVVELDDRDIRAQRRRAEAGLEEARSALEEVVGASRAAERQVEAARAHEELAGATLARYRALLERRAVAPQEYEEVAARQKAAAAELARARELAAALVARQGRMRARVAEAEAELARASVVAGYARLEASLAGVVVAKPVEVGNLAAPGVVLLTIEEERYRLEAAVEESEARRLARGAPATVLVDALGRELRGPVAEIVPAADPASRTVTVKVDLPAAAGLRSGLYGRARFAVGRREALLVPPRALVERGQLQGVWVVGPEGMARFRLVRAGAAHAEGLEILSGLDPGERVVVGGAERLSEGSRVEAGR